MGLGYISSYRSNLIQEEHLGFVSSIFAHSLNVCFGELLVHVGSRDKQLSCLGFSLDPHVLAQILKVVSVRDVVRLKDGILSFYTSEGVKRIDLRLLEVIPTDIPRFLREKNVYIADRLLDEMIPSLTLGLDQDEEFIRQLENLKTLDDNTMHDALKFFIGRGLGLTPSGDDILLGFGIVLVACNKDRDFKRLLATSLIHTTDVSRAYLQAFIDGHCNVVARHLISLLGDEKTKPEDIQKTLLNLSDYGHTSGADTLLGIKSALSLYIHERGNNEDFS